MITNFLRWHTLFFLVHLTVPVNWLFRIRYFKFNQVIQLWLFCYCFNLRIPNIHVHCFFSLVYHTFSTFSNLNFFVVKTGILHPAQSGQTVRLPVWPWQQVCVRPVRNGGGASIMNIHYDVTGWLTVVWRSHSGQIVWPAGVGQGRGGF